MAFLQMKQCIHRDLAARNVLVSDEGLCKVGVADFYVILCYNNNNNNTGMVGSQHTNKSALLG